MIFVHGWPERAISWRHQLEHFGRLGYFAVAPDMRGYGDSSIYTNHSDYAVEHAVEDMRELLSHLDRSSAIWVGHDWGSPVVWGLAAHYPQLCSGVANLCVPYLPNGFTLDSLIPLIDRERYPVNSYPAGQWDYFLYYREQFARAQAVMQANVEATVKIFFRKGKPLAPHAVARLALTRRENGWFGGLDAAPDIDMDSDVLDTDSLKIYAEGLQSNGFFGPNSWYMNDAANAAFAKRAAFRERLEMPVLFLHARFDHTCATWDESKDMLLAKPMREACANLQEYVIVSGHWMAQEQPAKVNAKIEEWLKAQ